jgi:hypothetical protein
MYGFIVYTDQYGGKRGAGLRPGSRASRGQTARNPEGLLYNEEQILRGRSG